MLDCNVLCHIRLMLFYKISYHRRSFSLSPPTIPLNLDYFVKSTTMTHLAIDDSLRDVEFTDHAKRDGTSTWLSVVHLTFEHDGVNSTLLGEDFGSTGSRWTSSDDSDLVLHVHVGSVRSDGILGNRSLSEGRRAGCKCTGGSGESRETLTTQTQFVSSDVSFNVFLFCWSFSISPRA